jgi:hypothetical protein
MSGRGFVLIMLLLTGAGCKDKKSVPRSILPEDKMEQVMWDMAQADQYSALYLAKDSAHIDRKAETMRLYAEVFRLHQVTPEEFRKSYRYYLDHPELNQVLFDSTIARGYRARSEAYDLPASHYHPPVQPVKLEAVAPGRLPAAVGPGLPGTRFPGTVGPAGASGQADIIRRMREAAARRQDSIMRRRQDSIMRVTHRKRDTTKRPAANGRS